MSPSTRPVRRRWLAVVGAAVVLAGVSAWVAWPDRPGYTTVAEVVPVGPEDDGTRVELDTTLYLPDGASAGEPVPAVLLAHGYGGTEDAVAADAAELARRGYAVLTWTARGFGASGGRIHLNHPDYEVRDARLLLDRLARRPEIRTDRPGDPRVGVMGGSYGGALALLLAAYDHRVDAVVAMTTWHDLADAFLPESSGGTATDGVFKRAWAALFFGAATAGPGALAGPAGADAPAPGRAPTGPPPGDGTSADQAPVDGTRADRTPAVACGRFAADLCEAYRRVAESGRGDPATVARLRESSPAGVLDRVRAPTLLIQGTADSLFPLSHADANAAGIAATGTPVRVAWFTGGHDGGPGPASERERLRDLTAGWLDHYVAGSAPRPPREFTWSRISGFSTVDRGVTTTGFAADAYPGLGGERRLAVEVAGAPQVVVHPPGGQPAALSSLPSAEGLASFVNGVVTDLPGQHARFESAPLAAPVEVVGAPTVRLRVASPTGEAVLFVKLYDVDPDGVATLPSGLVAPVRLSGLSADLTRATPVTVRLPAVTRRIDAGHTVRLVVATSDQAYATGTDLAVYRVAVDGPVVLPTVDGTPLAGPEAVWRRVLAGVVAVLVAGVAGAVGVARLRRGHADRPAPAGAPPLVVRELRKEYPGGLAAVDGVDFTVEPGQVVGLLGPNGAGKTTTLRMVLGLVRPTGGEVRLFGHRVSPGAPVLSRVGALVEGPGLLPHLSGRENLLAYWRATGRPVGDARMAEAVRIAGLGDAIDRKVRTYSHGMRQRLAVAHAMLGLPDLLLLDEPTDGLDPPQIAQMRRMLARYADGGRAVLLSSHLLAEVEQTCTHVVVMDKGRVVAAGPVAEVVGESGAVTLAVSDPEAATRVLAGLDGVRGVAVDGDGLVVDVDGLPRADLVAALVRAGVGVDRVVPRRRLEDAFLTLVGEDTTGSGDR
ncbi:MAG TPA: alpha/beta fold hydrolase [Natronosporangium sp.]